MPKVHFFCLVWGKVFTRKDVMKRHARVMHEMRDSAQSLRRKSCLRVGLKA